MLYTSLYIKIIIKQKKIRKICRIIYILLYKISILRQSILEVYFGINKLTKTYLSAIESNSVNVIIACAPLLPVPEKTFQYSVQGLQQLIYRKILTTKNFSVMIFIFKYI